MYSLSEKDKNKIVAILSILFPQAKIYLFGSRARKTHSEFSDIDLAIDAGRELSFGEVGEARDVLAGLKIPLKIDVLDIYMTSDVMRQMILKEGILWKN